jgi:hypothetical protein
MEAEYLQIYVYAKHMLLYTELHTPYKYGLYI